MPAWVLFPVQAQEKTDEGPASEKAQKTYKEGLEYQRQHRTEAALDSFRKADKQDNGRCLACQKRMIKLGIDLHDWRAAETGAEEMVAQAQDAKNVALSHFQLGAVLLNEGTDKHKDELFTRAHDEMVKALVTVANFPAAIYSDGIVLAHLKQDDAAKARFEEFVKMRPDGDPDRPDPDRQRALRYIDQPELARARMAPAFAITTTDGQRLTLDDLAGKVVLLDFWATWCGPCRQAVPHMQEIAKKFQGQPLVVLSISLDNDENKWKDFIARNEMTWLQYRDGGGGPIARLFGVASIPHTFTIDAEGVLQEEHIGDAAVEGKLKKLVSRAREIPTTPKPAE